MIQDVVIKPLKVIADERGYLARRALRNAFGGFAGQIVTPQPEDLGYEAVTVIA